MSRAVQAAEAEWLAQLASMRKAIQDLHLDEDKGDSSFRDEGLTDEDLMGGSGDDIWDITDDEYAEESSDSFERPEQSFTNGHKPSTFDGEWLSKKCKAFAAERGGFSDAELEGKIRALLASDSQGPCHVHIDLI